MDLKKMTKQELEALGYNQIKELQRVQYNIQLIEQELDRKSKEEKEK
jgi:hypothetical protein